MNNKSFKVIIIVLLSIILIGLTFYFYNDYREKQMIKKALKELNTVNSKNDNNVEASSVSGVNDSLPVIEENPQRLVNTKIAHCQIELAGETIYNGDCNFESSEGGSFSITGFELNQSFIGYVQEVSVEINEPNIGTVFGSNDSGSIQEWGAVKRSKGCWIGSNFKVCAYAKDMKSKSSFTPQKNQLIVEKKPANQISKEEELAHVRKVLDEGDAPPEVKIIVYCTRKAEIYHAKKEMQEIELTNCLNSLNPNI